MSPETLAYVYVYYLEPAFKVMLWLTVLVVVLYIFNMITDGKKKSEIINSLFSAMVLVITSLFKYGSRALMFFIKMLLRLATVLFDAVRDFFTSKI